MSRADALLWLVVVHIATTSLMPLVDLCKPVWQSVQVLLVENSRGPEHRALGAGGAVDSLFTAMFGAHHSTEASQTCVPSLHNVFELVC